MPAQPTGPSEADTWSSSGRCECGWTFTLIVILRRVIGGDAAGKEDYGNQIRDIVNDRVADPHADSHSIADEWFNEFDVQPEEKPRSFVASDTRSIPAK